jgi:ligand-binding sensor domain-containing protein
LENANVAKIVRYLGRNRCDLLRLSHFIISWNLICCLPLYAQEYSYVNYNTREGLAGSVVYAIAQDHDGFMWFATETGLSRFDGTRFKNFTNADGLPDIAIIKLFVDSKNRVWIAPFKNALCYYWRGRIYNARNDSLVSKLKFRGEVQAIAEDAQGNLAFMEHESITVVRNDGKIYSIREINGENIFAGFWLGALPTGSFGFNVTLGNSFCEYELVGERIHKINCQQGMKGTDLFQLRYKSPDFRIYRNQMSLKFFWPQKEEELVIPMPDRFTTYYRLNDSIMILNGARVEMYNLARKKTERTLLTGTVTNSTFVDRENNFWFATDGEGVYRLPSLDYRNYVLKEDQKPLAVHSLLKSGDTLYAGSAGTTIWTINTKTHSISGNKIHHSAMTGRVTTLHKLDDGGLLAGTDHKIFKVYGSRIIDPPDIYIAIKSTYLSGDTIIIGQSASALALSTKTFEITDSIWLGRTTAIYKQHKQIFVGTLNGLYILDSLKKPFFAGEIHDALKSRIAALAEDRQGNIWIATNGSGLVGYRDGRVFAWITQDSGLSSNVCHTLYARAADLWVGTDLGLNKVARGKNGYDILKYTVSDGLLSNIINAIWVDGTIVYAATPGGITWFDESKVNTNSMCDLKITSVQSPVKRWPYDTSGFSLPYGDRDIRIEFVGISFKSAGAITYRYRLHGLNEQWQQTHDNFLNYAALPSGAYELELQATNKFGVASKIVKLAFVIEKPFWEKTWFRLSILLLLGAAIWKFVHYRIQTERKKEAQRAATNHKMAELEQMALKAQMNPHFIFNSLHSIQQYVMDKDIRGANKFISDFARLIRLTLNISMQPKISLPDEINYLSTYLELEKTRLESKFDYVVEVAEGIDADSCYIPAMILQPHVENSIRHGVNNRHDKQGRIKVSFHIEKDYLVCSVEDNGIGRSATIAMKGEYQQVHQSKGMLLTQNRIDLLNTNYEMPITSQIEDVQTVGEIAGTKVTIRFPLSEVKKPV